MNYPEKVDGSIIRNILRSGSAAAKLKAILRVGNVTGVKVIAECVETKAVRDGLEALGAGLAQLQCHLLEIPLQALARPLFFPRSLA